MLSLSADLGESNVLVPPVTGRETAGVDRKQSETRAAYDILRFCEMNDVTRMCQGSSRRNLMFSDTGPVTRCPIHGGTGNVIIDELFLIIFD